VATSSFAWWRTTLRPARFGSAITLLKLINNFMCGVQAASLAEALALIESSGLDRAKALEVLTTGAPGSPLVKTLSGRMTARDYTPNFLLRLMAKDLTYALGEGRRHGLSLSTVASALEVLKQALAAVADFTLTGVPTLDPWAAPCARRRKN
jgi:3-hydroxyisobutyrate dehydrogenase-like beta-hydroxyacid dehydrogenase